LGLISIFHALLVSQAMTPVRVLPDTFRSFHKRVGIRVPQWFCAVSWQAHILNVLLHIILSLEMYKRRIGVVSQYLQRNVIFLAGYLCFLMWTLTRSEK
jgi:hypothetical protein